jgi:hypothetical protein
MSIRHKQGHNFVIDVVRGTVGKFDPQEVTRVCPQLSKIRAETNSTAARKFLASLSYRVAMARKCLILLKNRSTKFRSQ